MARESHLDLLLAPFQGRCSVSRPFPAVRAREGTAVVLRVTRRMAPALPGTPGGTRATFTQFQNRKPVKRCVCSAACYAAADADMQGNVAQSASCLVEGSPSPFQLPVRLGAVVARSVPRAPAVRTDGRQSASDRVRRPLVPSLRRPRPARPPSRAPRYAPRPSSPSGHIPHRGGEARCRTDPSHGRARMR